MASRKRRAFSFFSAKCVARDGNGDGGNGDGGKGVEEANLASRKRLACSFLLARRSAREGEGNIVGGGGLLVGGQRFEVENRGGVMAWRGVI